MTSIRLTAPTRISATHDLSRFDCGEPTLNQWLARRALTNEANGASRTYVVCEGNVVMGYYSLANGAIARETAPKRLQRNMPDPIPVMVMGRLAVDLAYQDQGIGRALLRDAIRRVMQAADIAGIKAILVHALSENAKQFYLRHAFVESTADPMTLCLSLATARRAVDTK